VFFVLRLGFLAIKGPLAVYFQKSGLFLSSFFLKVVLCIAGCRLPIIVLARKGVKNMAVVLEPNYSRCQVRLLEGVDDQGNPVLRSRTYGRILPTVSHEDVFEVFMALMSLQNLEVYAIRRLEDGDLINEE
jgi:hypothetical protein